MDAISLVAFSGSVVPVFTMQRLTTTSDARRMICMGFPDVKNT